MEDRITITEGRDRLSLQYGKGYFQALVWSSEHGDEWRCRAVITQTDFERGRDRERWISDLHSFDPALGRAIIKVGEMEVSRDKAGPGGFRRCIYSWRAWDLLGNHELEVLQVCEDTFEEYGTPLKIHKAIVESDASSVTIDCNCEGWDGCLYTGLYSKERVELRNLHSSYQVSLNELAEFSCMEFIGEFANNRGVFKRRHA